MKQSLMQLIQAIKTSKTTHSLESIQLFFLDGVEQLQGLDLPRTDEAAVQSEDDQHCSLKIKQCLLAGR